MKEVGLSVNKNDNGIREIHDLQTKEILFSHIHIDIVMGKAVDIAGNINDYTIRLITGDYKESFFINNKLGTKLEIRTKLTDQKRKEYQSTPVE